METKHTPGPWHYVAGAAWTTLGGPDDGGRCVATRASAASIPPWEKDCNLRLIAAAPELLAALVELVERAEAEGNIDGLPEYDQARAAIAKAKGE